MTSTFLLENALEAALQASAVIMEVYAKEFVVDTKSDASPVTEADRKADAVIRKVLRSTGIPVLSEEHTIPEFAERSQWKRFWLVDPLDGTKEFVKRNGEFTVNIALVEDRKPILGVIALPAMDALYWGSAVERKSYAFRGSLELTSVSEILRKSVSIQPESPSEIVYAGVSRSFNSEETLRFLQQEAERQAPVQIETRAVGSAIKFCYMAEGRLQLYPRFSRTMEWDTAAGQAICEAVGLWVLEAESGAPLRYNKEELHNPHFIVRHG